MGFWDCSITTDNEMRYVSINMYSNYSSKQDLGEYNNYMFVTICTIVKVLYSSLLTKPCCTQVLEVCLIEYAEMASGDW